MVPRRVQPIFSGMGESVGRPRGERIMARSESSALDHLWQIGYDHLSAFADAAGHTWVGDGYRCDDGFDLSLWVGVLAGRWVEGRLTAAQREQLSAIPGWTVMMDMAHWTSFPERRIAVG